MAYALLAAIFTSLKDLFGKKAAASHDEYAAAFAVRLFPLAIFVPVLVFSGQVPDIAALSDRKFILAVVCGGTLNILATLLYFRSIKLSDLSLSVPLTAFTPVFLLATSPAFFGEAGRLSYQAVSGVLMIAAGAYAMNIRTRGGAFLDPIRAILSQPGARGMLLVAFIWSITSNIDRIGVGASSPLVWVVASDLFMGAAMLPIVAARSGWSLGQVWRKSAAFFAAGTSEGIGTFCQMVAIGLAPVPAVIAMKRTSILWSALWGALFFKEREAWKRAPGIVMMLIGAIAILLWR